MNRRSLQINAKAKTCLMIREQVKHGEKFYVVINQESAQVTLLDSWENAVLALCDGDKDIDSLLAILARSQFNHPPTHARVRKCLSYFEDQSLIEPLEPLRSETVVDDPRSMAEVQLAFHEWHKQPADTCEPPGFSAPWSDDEPVSIAPSMEPTRTEVPVYKRENVEVAKTLDKPSTEDLLRNPPIPKEAMIGDSTQQPASSLNANTAAHRVLGAMKLEEESETDERSQSDLIDAVDEAAQILTKAEPKSGHPRLGDLDEDATLQIRTRSPREPSDRKETFIAAVRPPVQRMETQATKPAALPVFREWVSHIRAEIRKQPLGSSVSLRRAMSNFAPNRIDALIHHVTSLSELLPDKSALRVLMSTLQVIKSGQRKSTMRSHDAAVILTSILRSGRSAGVCVACLHRGRQSSTACQICGFRSLMIRDE
ncbi:MAG: hypothetical protein VYC39_10190 [Myxococcota bacterium]|nr:hypothetical protein [Myxococcota bacterium]